MNPTLRQIHSFVALAKCGSFTRAARQLSISQPALTVQIRQLESALGVQLFDRNTRVVRLTRTGVELLPRFERLQDEYDAIVGSTRDLAAARRGVVRLATLPSFASSRLPQAIQTFLRDRPDVSFVVRDASWRRVVEQVLGGEVDFGIGDEPMLSGLDFEPFQTERMQVIFPTGHPIARMKRVSLARLAEFALVMMAPETSARGMIDAAFAAVGKLPTRACEVALMSTAVAMVRSGIGIAILPESALDWRAHEGLATAVVADAGFVRTLGIIKPAGRALPPPSDAFARLLGGDTKGATRSTYGK